MQRRSVSILDVARAAGVSPTTVSHALNNKGRLPDATRQLVRQVANDLGYRPRAAARNLAGRRSGLLALSISQAEGVPAVVTGLSYFIQVMGSATATAMEAGYALVLVPSGLDGVALTRTMAPDGAIVVDPVPGDPIVEQMRKSGTPLVTTGRPFNDVDTAWVDNDVRAGTASICEHLRRRGARRIALLTSPLVTSFAIDSREGYVAWCQSQGLQPVVEEAGGSLTEQGGYDAAMRLFDAEQPPDAIYATFDRLALGVLMAAETRGIRVPAALLVASCPDDDTAKASVPALTSLDLCPAEVGRRAAQLLVDIIEDREPADCQVLVATQVLPRGSTRKLGAG